MVAVVTNTEKPLMPTSYAKARILLHKGRAEIYKHDPFTIKLLDREDGDTQPIEYCSDVGSVHVGVSVKSEKHEYVHTEYQMLDDEKKRHDAQRKIRRSRRNKKRYRKPRFNNRKKEDGWLPPSIQHKKECQENIFRRYAEVYPITEATFEVGKFDIQALETIENGKPLPEGADYQHGPRYEMNTLREAVFFRDNYTCAVCGRGIEDNAVLRVHHIGYLKGDHANRMGNLLTVCDKCHTGANHKKGGKLYDLKPKVKTLKDAAFMNTVRWQLVSELKEEFPNIKIKTTYGADTKERRAMLNISKTHANDAYSMGNFHPRHKAREVIYKKNRRNDRRLQKFYDAKYVDSRDGKVKSGSMLSSGRTSRGRYGENLHVFRREKKSRGHIAIRKGREPITPGSKVLYAHDGINELKTVKGVHKKTNVEFTTPASNGKKSASMKKLKVLSVKPITAWKQIK